eukprot:Seg1992.1 transcript_id=Seg1992.1/GoldUCD/mRNA.D3Y31 product="Upstream activation factor subunit spp27" protein_id=Seg1992.1/GoldUCD/D3Y31
MSEVTASQIKEAIKGFLVGADLTKLTSKKIRKNLEDKFEVDFTDRKKEIDEILMNQIEQANASQSDGEKSEESSKEAESSESEQDSDSSYEKAPKKTSRNPVGRKRPSTSNMTAKSKAKKSKVKDEDGESKPKKKTGFAREMVLSAELAQLVGTDKLSRGDVVKKMYAVIKERDLLDQSNKQFVICDDELHQIFGVRRFRAFGMMKYLKKHVKDPKDVY